MDLTSLLADPSYDLPVPPDALTGVNARAARIRRRRRVLAASPALAAALLLLPLAGGDDTAQVRYGDGAQPTSSPMPPPLPYQPPERAMTLQCVIDGTESDFRTNGGAHTDLLTGDPVADCADLGRQQGLDVPLRAYHDGSVFLTVAPAAWTLPSRFRPLPDGYTVDAKRLALQQALTDHLDGVSFSGVGDSPCRTDAEAIAAARQVVSQVGLTYEVEKYDASPVADGSTTCAGAFVKDGFDTVLVVAVERTSSRPKSRPESVQPAEHAALQRLERLYRFREALQEHVGRACLSIGDAADRVRADATSNGFGPSEYRVLTTSVGGDRCTRIDEVSGGAGINVVLRTG